MGTSMTLKRCLYIIPIICINIVHATYYATYFIENEKLCSLGFKPKSINIGKDEKSAAIVEEVNYFSTMTGKFAYNCKFKVESEDEMGIFAVVQHLNLRKNKTTGKCIDYVQFRHTSAVQFINVDFDIGVKSPWGVTLCGEINALALDFSTLDPMDSSNILPYAYIDPKGKMEVKIYIANDTITPNTKLDLKIAFTSFYECQRASGKYRKCGGDACIWQHYFGDRILNCPFTNCADESGCRVIDEAGIRPSAGLATKVMVGAVAGVFTMFIVFVMFLWLFKNCNLCWNDSIQGSQNTTQMRPIPTMEDVQPSVPTRTPSLDKDLPPSYESLFPNA